MFLQGNCREPLDSLMLQNAQGATPLDELRHRQCLVLTDVALGTVSKNTWLHNLYIRQHLTRSDNGIDILLWCDSTECNLWLTFVTVQGHGSDDLPFDFPYGGLAVSGGQMYADSALNSKLLLVQTRQLIFAR